MIRWRFTRARKPENMDVSGRMDFYERRRHHDMLLALRLLAENPTSKIWIPDGEPQLAEELNFLINACGGPSNVLVTDRLEASPDHPAGRTWELTDPSKAKVVQ